MVNTSDIISVHFGLYLIQILDVDEKDQILKTNIWYQYVSQSQSFLPQELVWFFNEVALVCTNQAVKNKTSRSSYCFYTRIMTNVSLSYSLM